VVVNGRFGALAHRIERPVLLLPVSVEHACVRKAADDGQVDVVLDNYAAMQA
jgi:hypothetical protein